MEEKESPMLEVSVPTCPCMHAMVIKCWLDRKDFKNCKVQQVHVYWKPSSNSLDCPQQIGQYAK